MRNVWRQWRQWLPPRAVVCVRWAWGTACWAADPTQEVEPAPDGEQIAAALAAATLSTTVNHYNASVREFGKIDKDVLRITGEGIEAEIATIERPQLEDGREVA